MKVKITCSGSANVIYLRFESFAEELLSNVRTAHSPLLIQLFVLLRNLFPPPLQTDNQKTY